MRYLFCLVVVLVGGVIGWYLDRVTGVQAPPLFWIIGFLTGMASTIIGDVGSRKS